MNIICKVFGHKPPQYAQGKGWGGHEYCKISLMATDGIGRTHVMIHGNCARCEKRFQVGLAHLPRIPA